MANKTVTVDLIFNTKTKELTVANQKMDKLGASTEKASKSAKSGGSAFSGLGASLKGLMGAAGIALSLAALAKAISDNAKAAISLNAELETTKNRLSSMIYINTQNKDSTGQVLKAQEKWALAMKEANKQLEKLQGTSKKTGQSVSELSSAYQAYATGAAKQMSFEQMQESFEALAIAAKGSGTSISALQMGLDNLASGTVVAGSELGIFLNSLGMSNETIKQAIANGQLYELIMKQTASAVEAAGEASQTYEQAVSALKTAWNSLLQESGSKYFNGVKKSINDLTAWIYKAKDEVIGYIDYIIESFGRGFEGIIEFFQTAFSAIGDLVRWIGSLFGEATAEMSAFEIALKVVGTTADAVGFAFKTLANMIKTLVEGIKGALNALQTAYYNAKDFFGLADAEDEAKMQRLIANRQAGAEAVRGIWEKQVNDTYDLIGNLEDTWTKKTEQRAKNAVSPNEQGGASLVQNFKSPATNALAAATKKQIDTLKSWWDAEFTLREKNIELMSEGKNKELAAEQLRFDKVISNLNFEIQKKLESGEISIEQANELYAVEEKLHEQKMKQIREYNETYENLKKNIDSALENNIQNALTGKFSSTKDFFKDLFNSMQQSFTQGLAQSMAQAIMSNSVMEAFTSTFSTAIEGISGLFNSQGATGGLANAASAGGEVSGMQFAGNVLAGAVAGYSFGDMVYSSMNDGFTSKADSWRDFGIGASALAGAGGGGAIGSMILPGIGTAIGSVVGGIVGGVTSALGFAAFGSKTQQNEAGVQLWSKATKDEISASLYADMEEVTKSWWRYSYKYWREYYAVDEQSMRNIRTTFRTYEWLLEDLGEGAKEISISAGRYANYQALANAGARSLINQFLADTQQNTSKVWSVWTSYASSVSKTVAEALAESLQAYVDTGNTFEAWKLEFEGKSTEALEFAADLANQQVDRILEALGAKDVTIDNYLQFREEALKKSFDPQTIEYINTLGEYLMSAAEATQKYEDALKEETKTKLNLIDPFLSKAQKIDEISASSTDTNEKLLVSILSTLKQTLRLNQESQEASLQLQAVRVVR